MMSRTMGALKKWWDSEAGRHFLWLPAGFAAGIALYFGLPVEPPGWIFLSAFGLLLILGHFFWRRAKVPLVALLLVVGGAAWASIMAHQHDGVVLREALEPRPVTGIIDDMERTEHGVRLTLSRVTIEGYPAELTPPRVRISVRLKKDSTLELPHIGDAVNIRAGLRPPMGPALPHGFDFARYFYFRDIGAVGFGLPPWQVIGSSPVTSFREKFWDWRIRTTEDIITTLGKERGAIAAGLITGDARAISEADFDALRASNLYHIIAISGEHMVVIAGVIFISLRLFALLLPSRIAHRPQVKTVAAVITLLLVTAYLFVTGLPVSAVRAYVMIFLVLLAVILRRHVDPMRSLAITAFLMLLYDPANLLDPGFRLSFAATLAIIALVESRILRMPDRIEDGKFRRSLRLIFTLLLISVVAEAATAPLVISMFNNVSLYGVFANMTATPLVSLFLMPTVALYFILLPLGLEHGALWLMDWGIRGLLGLARTVSGLPYAQQFVPSIPSYGVVLFTFGLLWVCLWRTRVRRYGIIPIVLGIATLLLVRTPDMLVGGELKQVAVRTDDAHSLARGRKSAMVPSLWANGLGYKELPKAGIKEWRCDSMGCNAHVKGRVVAFPSDLTALLQDCTQAAVVFTNFEYVECDGTARVFDKSKLSGSNVMALWIDGDKVRVERSADWQGDRPWSAIAAEDQSGE